MRFPIIIMKGVGAYMLLWESSPRGGFIDAGECLLVVHDFLSPYVADGRNFMAEVATCAFLWSACLSLSRAEVADLPWQRFLPS
mmetsp:Transcript_83845/g.130895  ORF Transcript_83845/g.130895 Transcript_83845/m.130895 type:complete len:84 (+) Transcript_83845:1054-1305(+)